MNEPLIELRHVDVALGGRTILRDVTWKLGRAEHWSVLGANGSGKSTFLRLLHSDVWPSPNSGERLYRLNGHAQTTAIGIKEQVALVSPESQHRYLQQEWQLSSREVIHTGFHQTDLLYTKPSRAQAQAAQNLARRLGITHLLSRSAQTLSTGELRKVLIARALVVHPKILLLDEVCDGLDAAFRAEMLSFIDSIARHGTQVVYTTHRADEALPSITHELVFDQGRIVRAGRAGKPVRAPRVSRTPKIRPAAFQKPGQTLISIRRATVYLARKKVLRGVSWDLRAGENWVVLGGNGAGKSTFLKLVASELYPAVGAEIQRFGLTRADTIWDLRHQIGCVSPLLQTHYCERISAAQVVASGFFSSIGLMDQVTPAQERRVAELLRSFGLWHLRTKPMDALSFGELRKLLMLRAMVHAPKLLIFDEPFDGLDAASRKYFASALDRVAASGTQLLVVTHHLDDLPRRINRGLFLAHGRIEASGDWPCLRRHAKVIELFG